MSYSSEDYEADKASEYLSEQAWEDMMEHKLLTCEHDEWRITDEGIVDVQTWNGGKKLDDPIAMVEIECCFCAKTNYGKVSYSEILKLLRQEFEHTGAFEIDEDAWG